MIYIKKNDIKNFIRPLRDKNNFTIGIYIRLYKNASKLWNILIRKNLNIILLYYIFYFYVFELLWKIILIHIFFLSVYLLYYIGNNNKEDKDPIPSPLPPQNPVLVVATKDYLASEPDQLSVKKDDLLVITDKNPKREWVFGYKYDNNSEKGLFPKKYIPLFNDEGKRKIDKI